MIRVRGRRASTGACVVLALAGCSAGSSQPARTAATFTATPRAFITSPAYPTFPYGQMDVDYLDIGPDRDCAFETTPSRRRPDLVGRTLEVVSASERAVGRQVRIIGIDGHCNYVRSDLRRDRANLYVDRGVVRWAGMG